MNMVSSCLLGLSGKYDGTVTNKNDLLMKHISLGKYLPICPEQLGGLPTPRPPVEITGGLAINNKGQDVTAQFIKGAEQCLYLAGLFPVKAAILKERSPSCGVREIYDGTFSQVVRQGKGLTAVLLADRGIPVYSEEDLTEELLCKLLDLQPPVL